jgi:hypothetical protein
MGRSKLDIDIGQRTGRSAASVERHRLKEGMWPAESAADIKRHYEVMDELGLGSGRDNWLIALQAAAWYEWPTVRLRNDFSTGYPVIPRTGIDSALFQNSAAIGLVHRYFSKIALSSDDVATTTPTERLNLEARKVELLESAGDFANAMADDAIDGAVKAITSEVTTPDDFNAFAVLVNTMIDQVPDAASQDESEPLSDEPLSLPLRTEMQGFSERMAGWSEWAQTASPRELVGAVKMADGIVSFLEATTSDSALTETERWRFVGLLAPMFGAELPTLEPIVTPMLASLKGATQLPPSTSSGIAK